MKNEIIFKKNDQIAEITLNRPEKLNALTFEMLDHISEIGKKLKKDKNLKLVVIRGKNKIFSSGIDFNQFYSLASNEELLKTLFKKISKKFGNKLQEPCIIWKSIKVPVISILEGPVFGAGLQLALGSDIRIANTDAKISIMETKWGLIPDMGISQFLPSLLKYDNALDIALSSQIINAHDAEKMGLVTKVVTNPDKTLLEYINTMNEVSLDAIKGLKKLLSKSWYKNKKLLPLEAKIQKMLIGSDDQLRAVFKNLKK